MTLKVAPFSYNWHKSLNTLILTYPNLNSFSIAFTMNTLEKLDLKDPRLYRRKACINGKTYGIDVA
jgi:hypothetical protein